MNEQLLLFMYKLISLLAGSLAIYWGYRLFIKGYTSTSGSFETNYADIKVLLKNFAPGTFFALVGGFILCFTIYKGLSFPTNQKRTGEVSSETIKKLDSVVPQKLAAIDLPKRISKDCTQIVLPKSDLSTYKRKTFLIQDTVQVLIQKIDSIVGSINQQNTNINILKSTMNVISSQLTEFTSNGGGRANDEEGSLKSSRFKSVPLVDSTK